MKETRPTVKGSVEYEVIKLDKGSVINIYERASNGVLMFLKQVEQGIGDLEIMLISGIKSIYGKGSRYPSIDVEARPLGPGETYKFTIQ